MDVRQEPRRRAAALFVALLAMIFVAALPHAKARSAIVLPPELAEPPSPNDPTWVNISIFLDEVSRIDVFTRTFAVTAQLVLEWQDERLVPLLASRPQGRPVDYDGPEVVEVLRRLWHPAVEISNEQNQRRSGVRALQLYPDGRVKLYEKFDSVPHLEGDMHLFPFVQVKLRLAMSAYLQDRQELAMTGWRYEFQPGGTPDSIIVGQWKFVSMDTQATWQRRSDEPQTLYSRVDFVLTIDNDPFSGFITFVLPLIMLCLVSIPLHWLDPVTSPPTSSPRVGGAVTLILTSVALQLTLRSRLPNVHYLVLTDYLFYMTLLLLTVSVYISCIYIYFGLGGRKDLARRIDAGAKIGYPAAFVVLTGAAFLAGFARLG